VKTRRSSAAAPVEIPWFFRPVDAASLAFFRIAFGTIMLWEVWRYFAGNRIRRFYLEPPVLFTYFGFDWVRPWPGDGMFWHFAALGILSVFIALGLWYRIAATLFFLGFTYIFLLSQAEYLNHFYLVSLISLLMIFIPAHRIWSVDARSVGRASPPAVAVPAWALWLLRAQIAIVYFFGGLAKLNADWLRGEPMRTWLANRADYPIIGPLFTQEWTPYFFSYGGLLFDLLIVPFLLWRRTRAAAFVLAVFFHVTNACLFEIGIFPWFMLAATTLFFNPGWPRRLLRMAQPKALPLIIPSPLPKGRGVPVLASIYLLIQLLIPLRHWLYPGNVHWTEEGHRFSWHMKLRTKAAEAQFFVTDPASGRTRVIDPKLMLGRELARDMAARPDMVLQYAHHLAREARRQGAQRVEVRARVVASLNGRPAQLLVDPQINLAAESRSLKPARWILPLTGVPVQHVRSERSNPL
jgi:vitamin K-dependent gamma-carboxylase